MKRATHSALWLREAASLISGEGEGGELRRPSTGLPFERLLHSLFDVAKCCHCLGLPSRLATSREKLREGDFND